MEVEHFCGQPPGTHAPKRPLLIGDTLAAPFEITPGLRPCLRSNGYQAGSSALDTAWARDVWERPEQHMGLGLH